MLVAVEHNIQEAIRATQTLTRMAVDEFFVVLHDGGKACRSDELVERILRACARPV